MHSALNGSYAVTRLDVPQLEEPVHWREYHFRPLHTDGGDVWGVDISIENVPAEQRARREAERSASHVRSIQLAGGIAHDFNNVLTIISSYAHSCLDQVQDAPELRGFLGKIEAAAERGARLTRQLLTFSPSQEWNPEPIDLNTRVSDIEQLVRGFLPADIELEVALEKDLPTVQAAQSQLEQVIMNLVVNARDAMPSGGQLTQGSIVVRSQPDQGTSFEIYFPVAE